MTLWEGGTDGGNRAASAGWSGRDAQSFQLVGVSPHRASDKRRREKIDVFGGEGFAKAEVVFARTRVVEKNFLRNRRFSTHAISLEKRTISFFGRRSAQTTRAFHAIFFGLFHAALPHLLFHPLYPAAPRYVLI